MIPPDDPVSNTKHDAVQPVDVGCDAPDGDAAGGKDTDEGDAEPSDERFATDGAAGEIHEDASTKPDEGDGPLLPALPPPGQPLTDEQLQLMLEMTLVNARLFRAARRLGLHLGDPEQDAAAAAWEFACGLADDLGDPADADTLYRRADEAVQSGRLELGESVRGPLDDLLCGLTQQNPLREGPAAEQWAIDAARHHELAVAVRALEGATRSDDPDQQAADARQAAARIEEVRRFRPEAPTPAEDDPGEPYPIERWPNESGLRDHIRRVADVIGCPLVMVAMPVLAIIAASIGNARVARPKRGWEEPATIWAAIVAVSGSKKTPAQQRVLKPLWRLAYEEKRRYDRERAEWDERTKEWEAEQKRVAKAQKAGDPDAALTAAVKPGDPPVESRIVMSDATMEALYDALYENPRGVMYVSDELSKWSRGMNRYNRSGGSDEGGWLSMWSADPVSIDRVNRGRQVIPRPMVSIFGGVQPRLLPKLMTDEHVDTGMTQRFLWAFGDDPPKGATEHEETEDGEQLILNLIRKLRQLTPQNIEDGWSVPRPVPLSSEAWRAFATYSAENAQATAADDDERMKSARSKLEAYALRIALVFWAIRQVAGKRNERIELEDMEAGIELVRWHEDQIQRVFQWIDGSTPGATRSEDSQLIEWIRRKGGTTTVRGLTRGPRHFQGPGGRDRAEAALEAAVERGELDRIAPRDLRGKEPVQYRLPRQAMAGSGRHNGSG